VTITWTGLDPDGVLSQEADQVQVQAGDGDDISPGQPLGDPRSSRSRTTSEGRGQLLRRLGLGLGDTTSVFYEGWTPQTVYFFALVAFDEAGAFEPRFNMDSNVLQFRPTLEKLGAGHHRLQRVLLAPAVDRRHQPQPVAHLPARVPGATRRYRFNWSANGGRRGDRDRLPLGGRHRGPGTSANETPREDDSDVNHWSPWFAQRDQRDDRTVSSAASTRRSRTSSTSRRATTWVSSRCSRSACGSSSRGSTGNLLVVRRPVRHEDRPERVTRRINYVGA
jgi:hypothetical protein